MEFAIDQISSDLKRGQMAVVNGLNVAKCTVFHTAPPDLAQNLSESGKEVVLYGIHLGFFHLSSEM